MINFNFILLFISQYLFLTTADLLTNEFAVHIPGGQFVADETARKYGFHNKGQIGSLEGYYLFEHHHVQKRSTSPSSVHLDMLQNDDTVLWFEQQQVLRRVKRKASNSGMDFKDPLYPEQWFLNSGDGNDMNVIPAWKEGVTGKGIVVTILDDGIQYSHPDLAQNYDKYASLDINDQDDDPSPRDDDDNKHGTRCAGEVAATANNEFCGVGIAYNASIGGVRMLDGSVTDSVEATALSLRPDHIHIYSASWGPDDNGKSLDGPGKLARLALENGINKGRKGLGSIFVWASGNGGKHFDNCNCDGYTNSIYTISVSSASQRNSMPWYLEKCSSTLATTYSSGANRDPSIITVDVDYAYVNEMRNSPNPPSPNTERLCTRSHTGTSASAPIAAGICALALEANPKLTWRDMQHIIVRTSNPRPLLKEDGWITNGIGLQVSNKFGFGIMNAGAMVELAKSWQTVGEQKICKQFGSNTEKKIPREIGSIVDSVNTTACQNGHNHIKFLEHVQVVISLEFEPRGYMNIKLISPRNTASEVLLPRPHDKTDGPFTDWPFMSVQFWGEDPRGEWLLKVVNSGDSDKDGRLISWSLVFYGTADPPPTDVNPEREEQPTRVLKKYAENNECFYKKQFQITLEGESECTSKCPLGQYGDLSDYTCHACDESCASCFGPSYKNCLSCQKYFLSNSICAKSCPDGFYPDTQTHQCLPCKPSCETCDSSKKCITCKPGLFLFGKKCLPTCPPETYIHQQSCKKCYHTCATCFGPLASQCITCPPLHYIHNSTCVIKCPGHYYMGEKEPSCNRCHRSCEFCTGFTSCTKCTPNWERVSIDSCALETKCKHSGWYNPQLGSCDDCDPNCEECSLPDTHNCATCNAGFVWHEGHCTGICPDGYFVFQDECSPCDELCSKCDDRDKCMLCKDNFLLHFGKCYPFCPLGYYDGGRRKCEVCHSACQHCTGGSENNCASCSTGYYLADNKCHTECPEGFFSTKENDCFPCYSTCETCTDFGPEYCTSCFDNSTHSDGFCIPCLDGEFYNKISRKCERCHTNCGRCFGPDESNCLSCTAPLRLDEVKHLCLPCCQGPKKSDCCSCSEHLDVCILADYPRSIAVNSLIDGSGEIVIPMKHVVPIVIAVCISVVLLYVILFGLLQANSMGLFSFKFGGQKYERVPNMTAKFDADMEKVSLTQEFDDEDEIYEKV